MDIGRPMSSSNVSPRGVRDIFKRVHTIKDQQEHYSLNLESIVDDIQESKIRFLKRRIEETKQRLQQVETQRIQESAALHWRKVHAKAAVREELRAKYANLYTWKRSIAEKRRDVEKITQYLKKENLTLRSEIRHHQTMIEELKNENKSLEKSNKAIEAAVAEMRKIVESSERTNQQLVQNINAYKVKLEEKNLELAGCDVCHQVESNLSDMYEKNIRRVSRRISKKSRADTELVDSIHSLTQDASREAMNSRSKEIGLVDASDINLSQRQRRSVINLEKQLNDSQRSIRSVMRIDEELDLNDICEFFGSSFSGFACLEERIIEC